MNELLKLYCDASGQRINMEKSSIYFSKGVSEATRMEVKNVLDVHNEALSDKYLGLPSDVGRAKEGCFKYLKDRLWNKIQGWIEKTMSTAGKEVLVKSVAQVIPVFSMSCFRLPRRVCESVTSIIRSSGT